MSQPIHSELIEVNEPAGRWAWLSLREIWQHRELVYYLARRDVAVRYKQTAVGVLWVVLQPLLLAGVFSVFLGLLTRSIPHEGVPYPAFVLTGMTMWLFLAQALSKISMSTVDNSALIAKIRFPRLVLPLTSVLQPAVDFIVAFLVLIAILVAYGVVPPIRIVLAPAILLLGAATVLGLGVWFAAIAVRYRDVKQIIPFLIQAMVFVTPIIYPLSVVPSHYRILYALNPFVAVLEGFRWVMLPHAPSPGLLLLVSVTMSAILIVTGLLYFARAESRFADII